MSSETRDHDAHGTGTEVAPEPGEPAPGAGSDTRKRRFRRPKAATLLAVFAIALFAAWGIGTPLIGQATTAATGNLVQSGPYAQAGYNETVGSDALLYDTYTSAVPGTIVFKKALQDGEFAGWDPNNDGGGVLGSVPNDALLSPLTVPYYVLPTWMGPAYTELLIIVCAVGGSFLFLRRLGLSRVAGLLGGLAFAGSGFMVMWVDFPQSRTAAFIPAFFWTVERLLQMRRVRDAVLIAVPIAAMLLGGFPAVTGYAGATASVYVLVRLIAMHRDDLRRMLLTAAGYIGGIVGGVGLVAFQLLPFVGFMKTWIIIGRSQTADQHLDGTTLLTMIAPWALGTGNTESDYFYMSPNAIESIDYIGAAALVLALVAVALPWRARPLLPRTVWTFFSAAAGVWLLLIYVGGAPLALLQNTPVVRAIFGQNFIGRSRSVLGFVLAVLVAIGYEILTRRRTEAAAAAESEPAPHRFRRLWPAFIGLATLGVFLGVLVTGYSDAKDAGANALGRTVALSLFKHQMGYAAAFTLAAIVCVVVLWYTGRGEKPRLGRGIGKAARGLRFSAAAALPLLLAWQSSVFASEFFPRSPVSTFYPVTDTHAYLSANLGEDRYASSTTGMVFGTNSAYALRAVNGHNFINQNFGALIDAIPGGQIQYETYIDFPQNQDTATSPVLDQLGAKYWVSALSDAVLGKQIAAKTDGSTFELEPGRSVTVAVPVTGRLRGIGITPVGTVTTNKSDALDVVVRNASGAVVAQTSRLADTLAAKMASGSSFGVPVAADTQAAGTTYTATLTWHGSLPIELQGDAGVPALSAVAGQDDGLELAHVDDSAIYERLDAQPRIRWASKSTVVRDQTQRISLLASGDVAADEVVLTNSGPAASGAPASVTVNEDGNTSVSTTVDAQGAGYLVVADADQVGWKAAVDGRSAKLRDADQGVVAVQVPAGKHVVTLTYAAPHARLGLAATGVTVVILIAAVVGEWWWPRRKRRGSA
ncbi:MAG TPA: YfhO family protein [Actinospica sp.]|nr:YfhO family protein [Actinospica sp.]